MSNWREESEENPEDTTKMIKCEICGKMYPKGSVCCGVSKKNQPYQRDMYDDINFDR
jgi:hypothetical protein